MSKSSPRRIALEIAGIVFLALVVLILVVPFLFGLFMGLLHGFGR